MSGDVCFFAYIYTLTTRALGSQGLRKQLLHGQILHDCAYHEML